jgi:hypothetical protein
MVGDRLFSAANTGVWSYDKGALAPVVSYQGVGTAAVASTSEAAYILAPAHSVGPGPTLVSSPSLYACSPECALVGAVPVPSVQLLAASGLTLEAASTDGAVVLSTNGGRSFKGATPSALTLPASFLAATDTRVWLVVQGRAEARTVEGSWALLGGVAGQQFRAVVPLTDTRLIGQLANGGLLCSDDGGATWRLRCAIGPLR